MSEHTAHRNRREAIASPPPPNAIFVNMTGAAGALGITLRRCRDLRRRPDFPLARAFGGGTLRWKITDLLAWAEAQHAAKFSTVGGPRLGFGGRHKKPEDEAA